MPDDRPGHGVCGLQNVLGRFRVLNFQAGFFAESDDEGRRIPPNPARASGAKQRLPVADLLRRERWHEVFDEKFFDFQLECRRDFPAVGVQTLSDLAEPGQA